MREVAEEPSLGGIALIRSGGDIFNALGDLFTQVVGIAGFMHATGIPQPKVLEIFDTMYVKSREALVVIMQEDAEERENA